MNYTATIPFELLQANFSDFVFMKSDHGWVRATIKNSLDSFLEVPSLVQSVVDEIDEIKIFENSLANSGEKYKITLSCAGQAKDSMSSLIKSLNLVPAEVTRLIFAKMAMQLQKAPDQAPTTNQNVHVDPFFKEWILNTPGKSIRIEQAQFYNYMSDTVNREKVGLIEAATGTGKSVAMIALAAKVARDQNTPVCIAVPTLSLIDQFRLEYENLKKSKPAGFDCPAFHQIFSKAEFLSQDALYDQCLELMHSFKSRLAKSIPANPLSGRLSDGDEVGAHNTSASPQSKHWISKMFSPGGYALDEGRSKIIRGEDLAGLLKDLLPLSLTGFAHCMGLPAHTAVALKSMLVPFGLDHILDSTAQVQSGVCKESLSKAQIAQIFLSLPLGLQINTTAGHSALLWKHWFDDVFQFSVTEQDIEIVLSRLVDFVRLAFFKANQDLTPAPWRIDQLSKLISEGLICELAVQQELTLDESTEPDDQGSIAYRNQSANLPEGPVVVLMTHMMLAYDLRFHHRNSLRMDGLLSSVKELTGSIIETAKLRTLIKSGDSQALAQSEQLQEITEEIRQDIYDISSNLNHGFKIPNLKHVWIDEAHLFEATLSRAAAENISVRALLRTLQNLSDELPARYKISQQIGLFKDAMNAMANCAHDEKIGALYSSTGEVGNPRLQAALILLKHAIDGVRIPNKKSKSALSKRHQLMFLKIASAASFFQVILNGKAENRSTFIEFSPIKAYPQISRGASNVSYLLLWLYSRYKSVCLVSATLYLPDAKSESPWYMQRILGVPDAMMAQYPPLVPAFLKKPFISVQVPSNDLLQRGRLVPPSSSGSKTEEVKNQELQLWLEELAVEISTRFKTSEGSMLVLNTSYSTARGLEPLLKQALHDFEIITASTDLSLSEQRLLFLSKSQRKRCIWLALGAAWTGLDVGGHSVGFQPEYDNLLTDLVITRLPFRLNKSLTHLHRMRNSGKINWEVYEMLFYLRQGLGRLVRVANLPQNRRIHVLDSRINNYPKVIEVMKKYPNFSTF